MTTQPVKGMRDFYPPEMNRQNWLYARFRETARKFNFSEYDACVLEHEELYIRKAGDEITGQIYNFEDKGGRRLSLRPEVTPSLARMVLARKGEMSLPLRWFCIGQCFRYERMQKGRKREHYQWNMDIIGDAGLDAELELLAALVSFFNSVGLGQGDIAIRVNNRKLLFDAFIKAGLPEEKFPAVSVIVDKIDKIGKQGVIDLLLEAGVCGGTAESIVAVMQAANLDEFGKALGFLPESAKEVEALISGAGDYGIGEYLVFQPGLVRGLSYYTGTVFEVFDAGGTGRAICGGGRYDRLIETFGGPAIPMVGFGFGDVVIADILEERGLFPDFSRPDKILLAAYSEEERKVVIGCAQQLRSCGFSCEIDLSYRKPKKLFARADREGFARVILVGPEEAARQEAVVKNLRTGKQDSIAMAELGDRLTTPD